MLKRDKLIEGYMQLKLGVERVALEAKIDEAIDVNFSLQEAIEIIQRNERGRQGRQRALLVKELREEEKHRKAYDTREIDDMDPEIAATHLQRMYRGFQSRKSALEDRENELIFIGMRPKPADNINVLEADLKDAKLKRKDEQVENRFEFDEALVKYHDVVRDEEGPIMKDDMMEERRTWFTNELAMGQEFPEDLSRFYLAKNPPTEDGDGMAGESGKKGKKKGKDKKGGKKDKKGGKKAKKGSDAGNEAKEVPPPLTGPTELGTMLHAACVEYERKWATLDEAENFAQKYDPGMVKAIVRPKVYDDMRKVVDAMLLDQLKNLHAQLEGAKKGGKKS